MLVPLETRKAANERLKERKKRNNKVENRCKCQTGEANTAFICCFINRKGF